jgi:hypothetical protein
LNVDEEDALLEFVFHPIDDFPVSTRILFAVREWLGFLRTSFLYSTLVHSLVLNFHRYVIKGCASKRLADGVIAVSVVAETRAAGAARSN